jgi:hypothetical protein
MLNLKSIVTFSQLYVLMNRYYMNVQLNIFLLSGGVGNGGHW